MSQSLATNQSQILVEVLQRVTSDLSMIADRDIEVGSIESELMDHRPAGAGQVHISYRLGFKRGDTWHAGCLLMPFVDSVALAGCLLMLPDETLIAQRAVVALEPSAKDAVLEIGNFVSGATDAALRSVGVEDLKVVFDGCQGVRADVRPVMAYTEGDALMVARAAVTVQGFEPQTYVVMLPEAILPS